MSKPVEESGYSSERTFHLAPDTEWWWVGTDYSQGSTPIYQGCRIAGQPDSVLDDSVEVAVGREVYMEDVIKRLRDLADFLEQHPDEWF